MSFFEVIEESEIAPEECDYVRPHVETSPCKYCGHCPTPDECVWSVECPLCHALAGQTCVRPLEVGRNIPDSFHEERWLIVKSLYGTYYK